ncbi:MAG: SDR family NAD(P)-dependent oxidoreductase, partial [Ornithinimicrobium sp.]|uniref:type I polyketide synthase n=1 Tax=Ornithinimicrobium sp. TaxID=1977084 RepID=UPI0026E0F5A3
MSTGRTLVDLLLSAARDQPDQEIIEVNGNGEERVHTFEELLEDSLRVAGGLHRAGLTPGTAVIILPGDGWDFLPSFWGALAAGLLPVPLAPAPEKVHAVWTHLGHPPVIVDDRLAPLLRGMATAADPDALHLLDQASLRAGDPIPSVHRADPSEVAFLQFSSGSTGMPKGVELTHANVLANIEQARTAGAARASDVLVTWLPYFHDMGLIGAHLTPLAVGMKQVKLDPADFAKRPALWFQTAHQHRATLLPMASFALAVTLRRVSSQQVAALDLSSVRLVGVGSEPIPVRTWRQFQDHLRPARLDPRALVPLYGLAEATLAVAFPPLGELAEPLVLDRRALAAGRALEVPRPEGAHDDVGGRARDPAEFMDVGFAVPGGELRIVDDEGQELGDSLVGHIEFRGPNVARGYQGRAEESAEVFVDGWLRTGDLGFLRSDRLCVTGRAKDVLFINGQKFHAHDLEQVVAATPGLAPGRVAVVGVTEPDSGRERVAVFLTSRGADIRTLAQTLTAVRAGVREALAYADVLVLPIPADDFPRTTSGKIQRGRLRERLAAGRFAALEQEVADACSATPSPATLSPATPRRSRQQVAELITDIWAGVLEVPADTISPEDRFMAIGGSSLAAMQVLGQLEEAFGSTLEPALLRDCATVAALTDHLLDHVKGESAPRPTPPARPSLSAAAGPAAVIAMACRLPDADTPEAFWDNLLAGRDSVTEVPPSRWQLPEGARARWGAFLDDVAGFDADYFGVSPQEAAVMDPHARIFLEVAHEALERAGYAGARRKDRRIGIFVAVGESGYPQLLHDAMEDGLPPSPAALVGNLRSLVAARVAHHLDLSGPALVVDTACSSALVALHQARRSLEAGECDLALVGGVHLNLTSTTYRLLEAAQALSPSGRSRAFSAGADGFVPGEGAAALVLEPLAAAQAAGDRVLAVVRGSAVNNDGRSLSLMAPNPLLQEAVITAAYRDADLDPATVSYLEAHGTGTAIGDPIEARSLMRAFPPGDGPRWLGSVKTNVGHLLNTAGMPSLLKVVLSLSHRQLPPSLHYDEPSPQFDLESAGLAVVREARPWSGPSPLRAGINGFGFGGTNAHVILEEAPDEPPREDLASPPTGPHLLTLSAASESALRAAATNLAAYARSNPDLDEGDVVRSASTARDHSRHRLALPVQGDLAPALESLVARGPVGSSARRRPRVVFVFPGQGSQFPGMGVAMHRSQAAYRGTFEELSAAVGPLGRQSLLGWSLDVDADPTELAATAVAQPLLVAFGISLAAQLRAWGVRPDAVVGHSVGELTAAAVCGALDPVEAVRFAAARGRAMQDHCAPGAMAAVSGAELDVLPVLEEADGELALAARNAPGQLTISGTVAAVETALQALAERGCHGRRLSVSRAFHSAMMEPSLQALRVAAADLTPAPSRTPLMSTVTGDWAPTLDPDYLVEHARETVRFGPALDRLLQEGFDTFLEVGPGATLTALVTSIAQARHTDGYLAVPLLGGKAPDPAALIRTVGKLWMTGVPISRPDLTPARPRAEVPTYPFQHQHHWLPEVIDAAPTKRSDPAPLSALLHGFGWEDSPLPAGSVLRSVCLVGARDEIAEALADRLVRRGLRVHHRAVGALHESPPASVVVLLCGPVLDLDVPAALDGVAREATAEMLTLCRQLDERPTPLIVVTQDVSVTGTVVERARPGHAILAGLALALPEENPKQGVRVVDLSSLDDTSERLDALVRELDSPPVPSGAESVAWRRGRRLTKVPLLGEALHPDRPARLRADGRYLITGGAGGVGSAVARFLAGRGHPEIFLTGRSPAAPPGLLDQLQELGATAHYVTADLTVASDVDRLVAGLPTLDGVFHAAGLASVGALRSVTEEAVREVLSPKVRGTVLLSRALDRHGRRPDTFMLFSSVSSALSGYAGGLGSYAAANAFLDAFAAAETASGRPAQALNFAAWADTGMASSPLLAVAARTRGVPQVSCEAALEALHDATSLVSAQLLVMDAGQRTSAAPALEESEPAAPVEET